MGEKLTAAVLFGGQSSEHEISCMSVVNVVTAMNAEKYTILLIGITKDGRWLLTDSIDQIIDGSWRLGTRQAILSPDASNHGLLLISERQVTSVYVDVVFPVLHGMYGEDGTVQGLLELARIPYVGCGVLSSAVSMDKATTKVLVNSLGIRQADYVVITRTQLRDVSACTARVEEALDYPVFVKPSKAGSSKGVSKAANRKELIAGLAEAVRHDAKVLVEETIRGREIECAVLGGCRPQASGVGEVLSADQALYSYEAKYFNAQSQTQLHPVFAEGIEEKVREAAIRIFSAVDGFGLARVDFFLEEGTDAIVFNEINTLPGFTGISMYPMLWKEKGVDNSRLIDILIELAFEREEAAGGTDGE